MAQYVAIWAAAADEVDSRQPASKEDMAAASETENSIFESFELPMQFRRTEGRSKGPFVAELKIQT